MKLPFVLLAFIGLSWIASGDDCKDFKRKVRAVIGPILGKRKGLHVTLSPDDLANLVDIKHGCVDSAYNDSSKKVHFAAYLTKPISVRTDEAVKFDKVEINQGGGYNASTGVFTCPKSGTYLISWFFLTPRKSTTHYMLRLDINGESDRYAGMNNYQAYKQGFRSHLVLLKKGDRVHVESGSGSITVLGHIHRHTGFSALFVSA